MHDFYEEEVDLLSVSLNKTKHEVEFKEAKVLLDKNKDVTVYWSGKKKPGFPKEALEFATFKVPQGEKKLSTFIVALTHDR